MPDVAGVSSDFAFIGVLPTHNLDLLSEGFSGIDLLSEGFSGNYQRDFALVPIEFVFFDLFFLNVIGSVSKNFIVVSAHDPVLFTVLAILSEIEHLLHLYPSEHQRGVSPQPEWRLSRHLGPLLAITTPPHVCLNRRPISTSYQPHLASH